VSRATFWSYNFLNYSMSLGNMFFLSQWLPLSARFFSGLVTT
jgi:hypothetical protein